MRPLSSPGPGQVEGEPLARLAARRRGVLGMDAAHAKLEPSQHRVHRVVRGDLAGDRGAGHHQPGPVHGEARSTDRRNLPAASRGRQARATPVR